MKHCPACNFTFPDSHRVCDFDGSELVLEPERQSLMRVRPAFSYPQSGLKMPMLLTSLAMLGVFLSAAFIGYLESPAPSIPAIVRNQESQNSPRGLTHVARPTLRSDVVKKTAQPSNRTGNRRVRVSVSSTSRLREQSLAESRSRIEVSARTRDSKRTSKEKLPKIAAIFKTTWKVLKKPFDF